MVDSAVACQRGAGHGGCGLARSGRGRPVGPRERRRSTRWRVPLEGAEPMHDHVQPGGTRGYEVEDEAGMRLQPCVPVLMRELDAIAQDPLHGLRGKATCQQSRKGQRFLLTIAAAARPGGLLARCTCRCGKVRNRARYPSSARSAATSCNPLIRPMVQCRLCQGPVRDNLPAPNCGPVH